MSNEDWDQFEKDTAGFDSSISEDEMMKKIQEIRDQEAESLRKSLAFIMSMEFDEFTRFLELANSMYVQTYVHALSDSKFSGTKIPTMYVKGRTTNRDKVIGKVTFETGDFTEEHDTLKEYVTKKTHEIIMEVFKEEGIEVPEFDKTDPTKPHYKAKITSPESAFRIQQKINERLEQIPDAESFVDLKHVNIGLKKKEASFDLESWDPKDKNLN